MNDKWLWKRRTRAGISPISPNARSLHTQCTFYAVSYLSHGELKDAAISGAAVTAGAVFYVFGDAPKLWRFGNETLGVIKFGGKGADNLSDGVIKSLTKSKNSAKTWNEFQSMTKGKFLSRTEAGKAWTHYKGVNGIVAGNARNQAQKRAFLKQMQEGGKAPKWMNQWLPNGKSPPGYSVDHITPLSIGGADIPSNMRLLDDNFHYDIHHAKYKPWLNK